LVDIPTVNPPGEHYREIVDFLAGKCKEMGMKVRKVKVPLTEVKKSGSDKDYPRYNLLADYNTGNKRTLHVNGHIDVVPVTKKWKTNPFKAVVRGSRLYGRGSQDMKGAIACELMALKALQESRIEPKVNLQYSFTCDEETGGELGFKYLVGKGLIKANYAMGEGGKEGMWSHGMKGILWALIDVPGKAAHGAYPCKGDNSFETMLDVATELRKLKNRVDKRRTNYRTEHPQDRRATFVMGGLVKGGNKINIVPGSTSFSIDRRVLPEEEIADAKQEIVRAVRKVSPKARIAFTQQNSPAAVNPKEPFCRIARKAVVDVYGTAKPMLLAGGTDMRFIMHKGIPAVGYNASGGNIHGDDEYVSIPSLVKTTEVYARIMGSVV
jgi:succinyl-diaminopimelate desuccinylase